MQVTVRIFGGGESETVTGELNDNILIYKDTSIIIEDALTIYKSDYTMVLKVGNTHIVKIMTEQGTLDLECACSFLSIDRTDKGIKIKAEYVLAGQERKLLIHIIY